MSEKARQSRAWDEQHLRGPWLTPVKWVLRAFSSITLAVILLVAVCVYGVTASVPVGMLVWGLTYALYGLTLLVVIGALAVVPAWFARRAVGAGSARFVAPFVTLLVMVPLAAGLWYWFVWPILHYDPATGKGLKLWADFVTQYKSVTVRRLPGVEMSELEYYSWWPLRVILLLFVVNMVVATVRRIDFTFKNIGVLTVHTGIVIIALGSVYYSGLKLEGDTLLLAGQVDPIEGKPGVGPSQDVFYDNTDVSLWVTQDRGWEQRGLAGVPRYNDYGLEQVAGESAWELARLRQPWKVEPARDLSLRVPHKGSGGLVDEDLRFRVVGYASYAEAVTDWVRDDVAQRQVVKAGAQENPLRVVFLHSALPDESGRVAEDDPVFAYTFLPGQPSQRASVRFEGDSPVLSAEYTLGEAYGMTEQRWRDLSEELPSGTTQALVIEVGGHRQVTPVTPGATVRVGDTGFMVRVQELHARPPFPIITKGYEKATSSVAVVQVMPPAGVNEGKAFTRYVYHRFPELNQDILGTKEDGRPIRKDADAAIRIALIESGHLAIYLDEPAGPRAGVAGAVRAIVRQPGGSVRVVEGLERAAGSDGSVWLRNIVDKLSMRVGARWEHAVQVERPRPVPAMEQNKEDVGTHAKAMLAVEVTSTRAGLGAWRSVVWLPFSRYMGLGSGGERVLEVPDGRYVTLAFGRTVHRFPNFAIALVDFQMVSYDHRGAPRDYQSVVRVTPSDDSFVQYEHVTQLNAPLMAPFHWSPERRWIVNLVGRLASGLSPFQFKLSQAGWDQQGWNSTQAQVDAGQIPRAYAKFTILGVGNNPGIHVIALGGILMGVGIPWAFYVKPWLVQREKRILSELATSRGRASGGAGAARRGDFAVSGQTEKASTT